MGILYEKQNSTCSVCSRNYCNESQRKREEEISLQMCGRKVHVFSDRIYKKLWNLFTAADRSRLVQADLEILAATTHIVGSRAREFEISDFQANEVNDA